jgi:hypothetical protein
MGRIVRSTVRKAARFAVYEDKMMRVKNHHMPPTIRVDVACKPKVNYIKNTSLIMLSWYFDFIS